MSPISPMTTGTVFATGAIVASQHDGAVQAVWFGGGP